jgi:hypothetical protein
MAEVEIRLGEKQFRVPALVLRQTCQIFSAQPLPQRYRVNASVSTEVFELFLAALRGNEIEVTKANFQGFSSLCAEFQFEFENRSYRLGEVEVAVEQLRADIGRLFGELNALRGTPEKIAQLGIDLLSLQSWTMPVSTIVSNFPGIFGEFLGKQLSLLWRGSRDGFKAQDFHRRCDGHPNTLTVVLDTNGNIFGGFTPVKWESRAWTGNWRDIAKADESQKSFIFSLKNPRNFPAKRFALKREARHHAIECASNTGPRFWDFNISDNCNANNDSYAHGFGQTYTKDPGLDENTFLTGAQTFKVKEIEVFEMTN